MKPRPAGAPSRPGRALHRVAVIGVAPGPVSRWVTGWTRLLRARALTCLLIASVMTTVTMIRVYSVIELGGPFLQIIGSAFLQFIFSTLLTFAIIAMAEALPWRPWSKWSLAIVASLGLLPLSFAILGLNVGLTPVERGIVASNSAWALDAAFMRIATAMLLIAFYATRERQRDAARAAQDEALGRANAQRSVVESRLKVMQARVEPEFLFCVLDDVQALYRDQPEAAERLLDDLIHYLRTALPQMRGDASSVGREVALAQAYLAVLPNVRSGELKVALGAVPDVVDIALPPMVLLPLVQALAAEGRGTLSLQARRVDAILQVLARLEPAPPSPTELDAAIGRVRETLVAFYADAASLVAQSDVTGTAIRLEVPIGGEARD